MCSVMQTNIYYVVHSCCLEKCDVMVTYIVTTSLSFIIYYHGMLPKYLEMCDVTIYVTPTMSNLKENQVIDHVA
jgi:hypothetical protein